MAKTSDTEVRSGFESWLCHLLVNVRNKGPNLWALVFSSVKWIIKNLFYRVIIRVERDNAC